MSTSGLSHRKQIAARFDATISARQRLQPLKPAVAAAQDGTASK